MKVAVDLTQPGRPGFQTPSPADDLMLDLLEQVTVDEPVPLRISVGQSHDAFAVTDQFANAPCIKARIILPDGMDLHKVVTQLIGPPEIFFGQHSGIANAEKVAIVTGSLRILGQDAPVVSTSPTSSARTCRGKLENVW